MRFFAPFLLTLFIGLTSALTASQVIYQTPNLGVTFNDQGSISVGVKLVSEASAFMDTRGSAAVAELEDQLTAGVGTPGYGQLVADQGFRTLLNQLVATGSVPGPHGIDLAADGYTRFEGGGWVLVTNVELGTVHAFTLRIPPPWAREPGVVYPTPLFRKSVSLSPTKVEARRNKWLRWNMVKRMKKALKWVL